MIHKSEFTEQIDLYLNNGLTKIELIEFEFQLETDFELAKELKLHQEVELALGELDVIGLRENLNQIVQKITAPKNISVFDSFSFGLTEEFLAHENLDSQVNMENILSIGHSFPRLHLYQHKIAGKENIHQFYKEQVNSDSLADEENLTPIDEELFADVQNAMGETDILDIRANLKQIAKSMPAHQYSDEEIDSYLFNRMDPEQRTQFKEELKQNTALAQEVHLHREIDLACNEKDIMELRASMKQIHQSSFNSTARLEEIEGYIYNELSEDEMTSFEAKFASSHELKAEIDLVKNIDLALAENDIMLLRNNLQEISRKIISEKQTERSFITKFKSRKLVLTSVAASLILLLGISGLISRQSSQDELYQNFYSTYQATGISRSASLTNDKTLSIAMQKFNNQDYEAALNLLQDVVARDQGNMVGHFYSGVSLRETGKFKNAIREYETVIVNKDNLFVEQANWYIGLCYLQTNENKKAYIQFNKIVQKEGFYQQKAQSILQRMNYSE